MVRKRTLLFCYYDLNLGDDLFIRLTMDYLGKSNVDLLVPDGTDEFYYQNYSVKTYSKLARRIDRISYKLIGECPCLSKIASKYDQVAVVGGSMFIQKEGWEASLRMYQMLERAATNFFIIGSNFGPYKDNRFLDSYRNLFEKSKFVTFRDTFSKQIVGGLNSQVYPDMIFNQKSSMKSENTGKKVLGVSVIDLEDRNYSTLVKQQYLKSIVEICKLFQSKGYEIRLFAFCENQGDLKACTVIKEQINNAIICKYDGAIDKFLGLFEECSYIVASRFHAMILGWNFGIPTLPIIYSDKALNVINDLNQEIKFWKIENITSDINKNDFSVLNDLIEIKKLAKGHLKVLKCDETIEE